MDDYNKCDGTDDCGDNSDEQGCGEYSKTFPVHMVRCCTQALSARYLHFVLSVCMQ